jgi:hypothetical protein
MADDSRREYAQWILSRGGGMITTGGNLGIFVSEAIHSDKCPNGWMFFDVKTTTVDDIVEAMEQASKGRKLWPKNAKDDGKQEEE